MTFIQTSPIRAAVVLVLLVAIVVSTFDPIGAIWIVIGSLLGAFAALAVLAISAWRSLTFRNEDIVP
jgi:protein-S-isoprenylcysteine O-methyltransferase Ste14